MKMRSVQKVEENKFALKFNFTYRNTSIQIPNSEIDILTEPYYAYDQLIINDG